MWLYPFAGVLFILGVGGTFVFGGIYTLVLIPLSLIIAGSTFLYHLWGRAGQGAVGIDESSEDSRDRPLPHNKRTDSGRAPSSPERLVDARRVEQ